MHHIRRLIVASRRALARHGGQELLLASCATILRSLAELRRLSYETVRERLGIGLGCGARSLLPLVQRATARYLMMHV